MTEKRLSLTELAAEAVAMCLDMVADGSFVLEVDNERGGSFIVGPERLCGRVLGLYDAEYGWPSDVHIDGHFDATDLVPGPRRHPFLLIGKRCVAVAISRGEYETILRGAPECVRRSIVNTWIGGS